MAVEIRDFTVTVPAGTAVSAGFASDMAMPPRIVTQINVRVPPGPRGEVGFKIGSGGIQILPAQGGDWIVTDNEDLTYPLTDTLQSGAWQLLAYNTGSYDHTLRVYFYCDLIAVQSDTSGGSGSVVGTTGTTDTGTGGSGTTDTGTGGGGTDTGTGTPTPPTGPTTPTTATPVLLPPSVNIPPSLGGPVLPADPSELLIGVADLSEVWLLTEDAYVQCGTQDDVSALSALGIQGVAVSSATHTAILAAMPDSGSIEIGPDVLAGWWQAIVRGGVPARGV